MTFQSVRDLLQLTSRSSPRIQHRIAVFTILPQQPTPDGPTLQWHVSHAVSQSDVVRLLCCHMPQLGTAIDRSVRDFGLVQVGLPKISFQHSSPGNRLTNDQDLSAFMCWLDQSM